MGKWATYRRKGSTPPKALALLAPPAPTLAFVEDLLTQVNTGDLGLGSTITLYTSAFEIGPWVVVDEVDWEPTATWGEYDALAAGWYVCTQTCSPPFQPPESPYSNAVHRPL
jgi:hypothetical protein